MSVNCNVSTLLFDDNDCSLVIKRQGEGKQKRNFLSLHGKSMKIFSLHTQWRCSISPARERRVDQSERPLTPSKKRFSLTSSSGLLNTRYEKWVSSKESESECGDALRVTNVLHLSSFIVSSRSSWPTPASHSSRCWALFLRLIVGFYHSPSKCKGILRERRLMLQSFSGWGLVGHFSCSLLLESVVWERWRGGMSEGSLRNENVYIFSYRVSFYFLFYSSRFSFFFLEPFLFSRFLTLIFVG